LYTDDQDVKQIGHVKATKRAQNIVQSHVVLRQLLQSPELKYLHISETPLPDFENVRVQLIHMLALLEGIDETTRMVTGRQEFQQMVGSAKQRAGDCLRNNSLWKRRRLPRKPPPLLLPPTPRRKKM
jgi:hypothetical protein